MKRYFFIIIILIFTLLPFCTFSSDFLQRYSINSTILSQPSYFDIRQEKIKNHPQFKPHASKKIFKKNDSPLKSYKSKKDNIPKKKQERKNSILQKKAEIKQQREHKRQQQINASIQASQEKERIKQEKLNTINERKQKNIQRNNQLKHEAQLKKDLKKQHKENSLALQKKRQQERKNSMLQKKAEIKQQREHKRQQQINASIQASQEKEPIEKEELSIINESIANQLNVDTNKDISTSDKEGVNLNKKSYNNMPTELPTFINDQNSDQDDTQSRKFTNQELSTKTESSLYETIHSWGRKILHYLGL